MVSCVMAATLMKRCQRHIDAGSTQIAVTDDRVKKQRYVVYARNSRASLQYARNRTAILQHRGICHFRSGNELLYCPSLT